MITAILIDDEVLMVQALEKIITSEFSDISIVAHAYDGVDAFEKIKALKPDMLIMDIRMPLMDGLELMKCINEHSLKIQIIVISAYRDFEYAQKALECGAFRYLVKPIDKVKLIEVINKLKVKILEEKKTTQLKDYMDASMPIIRDKHCNELLQGHTDVSEKNIEDIFQDFSHNSCTLMLIVFDDVHVMDETVVNFCKDYLRTQLPSVVFVTYGGELAVIIDVDDGFDITVLSEKLVVSFNQTMKRDLNIAIGGKIDSFLKLSEAYLEARIAMIYKFYIGINTVIFFDSIKEIKYSKNNAIVDNEELVIDKIRLGLNDEVEKTLDEIYTAHKKSMSLSPQLVYSSYYEFMLHIKKALKKTHPNAIEGSLLLTLDIDHLNCLSTLDGLASFVKSIILDIALCIETSIKNSNERIIEKVMTFCNENYSEDITLDIISEHVNMTKNYFCSYYKKKTNGSFWEYLTNLRICKAKVLLETTEMRINVVSKKVGYKNTSHFCRIFKETVGVSPTEYKLRAHLHGANIT